MQLWELKPGDKVTLEVVWGTAVYPLNAVIYRPVNEGVYIRAFYKNGQLLDFSNKAFQQATFNLYAYLENGGTRVVWKNVNVGIQKLKMDFFYIINVSAFAKNSAEVNRRTDARVKIFSAGTVTFSEDDIRTVLMKDISNSGVAFTMGEDEDIVGERFDLEFSDEANGHDYELTMKCKAVRKVPLKHGFLIGCTIEEGCKDLIFYVYYKLLAERTGDNTDQVLKMDTTNIAEPAQKAQPKKGVGMHFERNKK